MNNYHTKNHLHVKTVTLRIKNEAVMLDYYLNVMKMKIIKQDIGRFYLGTEDGNVLVILEVSEKAKVVNGAIGLYHYALLLPTRSDLASFFAHYLKTNGKLVGASDHHVSEAIYVEDPEGNGIEIYVDRSDATWLDASNQLYMITKRLDVEDLFKAQKDEYKMLPNKTIIGHLHLHVSDLEKANAFFVGGLGFDVLLNYRDSAEFVSSAGYHHHVAYNVWRNAQRPIGEVTTGLIRYFLNVPLNDIEAFKKRLLAHNIMFSETNNRLVFNDMNNTEVVVFLKEN